MAADSRSLGVFHLRGLPPMPAGIPRVEVEFLVDAGGVLSVAATETRSGTRASIQIVPHHGLTRDEVDRLEAESLLHAREDMTRHRVVDLAENSALDVKWIGDRLAKVGGDLEPAYRAELEASVQALARMVALARERWQSVNPDEFYKAKEDLDRLSMRLHEVSITQSLRGPSAGQ
jgi:molecular chaperone DnaK (HSP70)